MIVTSIGFSQENNTHFTQIYSQPLFSIWIDIEFVYSIISIIDDIEITMSIEW